MVPEKVCDMGAGFLCVNTPSLGVEEDHIMIKGSVDLRNNILSSLSMSVQNEYTNEYKNVKFDKPEETSNCWESASKFCLDADGFFAVRAELGERYGPFTILLTAARENGPSQENKVRTSRVTPLALKKEDVKLTVNGSNANLEIDLLHACQACDFIGISTGGVTVTVENIIESPAQGVKQITEKTNIAGGGIFSLCLPLKDGKNTISVTACNAATGPECPKIDLEPVSYTGEQEGISWLKPVESIYSADINPEVSLDFTIAGTEGKTCDSANIRMIFNRKEETRICPDSAGIYRLQLKPDTGINVGKILSGDESYSFTFGWGEISAPFEGGRAKTNDNLWIKNAGGFSIGKDFLTGTVKGLINNFLKSDEFKRMLVKLPEMFAEKPTTETDKKSTMYSEIENLINEIPMCKKEPSDDEKSHGIRISKSPSVELIEIPKIEFKQDAIGLILNAENVSANIEYFLDEDENGVPDKRAMPLKIGFKKIFSPIELKVDRTGEKPLFLLSGPSTDCEYKSRHACMNRPAIIVPKDIVGNATKGGYFVKCDESIDKDCVGINIRNAQTGIFSTVVLDAINELLYCKGSATLTYMIREYLKEVPIQIGNIDFDYPKDPLIKIGSGRGFMLPLGLDLLNNQFSVSEKGIYGTVPAIVGSEGFYSQMPAELRNDRNGFLKRPYLQSTTNIASKMADYDIGISIGEDLLNAILFLLVEQDPVGGKQGIFDWDIHEGFLKAMGFDSVSECDEFKPESTDDKPSAICNLRPRVGDILGSALTANGYFGQKYPIMISIRGNRSLAPHINFFNMSERQFIDFQLGEIEMSFYALQTDNSVAPDKYGNYKLKLDDNGQPVILSMNPTDPDPRNGQITKFKLSALIALEITEVKTDEEDPSLLSFTIRPDANLSRIEFRPIAGGNTTVISDRSMMSALEEKINFGLNIYSEEKNAIRINLPKEINFKPTGPADQFGLLGLEKITFGRDGIQLKVEDSQEFIDILGKISITQSLHVGSQKEEFLLPK